MQERQAAQRLSALTAVTDSGLSRLDLDELLGELLERVRGILDADTAAVLLLEDGGGHLVARAARGLEEEVRQGVKIPVGVGFAGSIAATRQAVRLDRVDSTTVANPILWEKGIRTMLGVPLVSNGKVTGVLHVGRLEQRGFADDDVELLQIVADRIIGALQSRQLAVEMAAAQLLERGLLPTLLPRVRGVEFASRYVPADSRIIGGDWYDAFVLPSGVLWLVTGDVAGHGLDAALVMGRVRSALRAYALTDAPVAEVVALTDRKLQHFEIGSMVTVVCVTAAPPYDRAEVCSAGHLPPVLAEFGRPAELLTPPVGPPLGVDVGARREAVTVDLPAGATLVLYTDGLVERRDSFIAERLEVLCGVTEAGHPEIVCRDIMHALVGSDRNLDDIAVLAVRRTPGPDASSTVTDWDLRRQQH